MRAILISIALLFGIVGYGQISGKDSISILTQFDPATGIIWVSNRGYDSIYIRPDTTRVIMLVSDTSAIEVYCVPLDKGDTVRYDMKQLVFNKVWWQYGYMVNIFNYEPSYLDENKKPLGKNIVLWNVIEIKH